MKPIHFKAMPWQLLFGLCLFMLAFAPMGVLAQLSLPANMTNLMWVAYTPTNYDPDAGIMPSEQDIRDDLTLLFGAGFRGIVTYGSAGGLADVPRLARETGFEGVIMGIWTPGDAAETGNAINAAPYVDGYVVGNEGLTMARYSLDTMKSAVADLRSETGKPVTTTEVVSLYVSQPELIEIGDWVFANAHPYWQQIVDPAEAVAWTESVFADLQQQASDKLVMLKEVGLPSAGSTELNEFQQAEYYDRLRRTPVKFVFFEAFDQFWKHEETNSGVDVGPHWGLFNADRSPKVAAQYLNGHPPIYVYADDGAPQNHFEPEGWMGCVDGIDFDPYDQTMPYMGDSSIRITYTPNDDCNANKLNWAGIYWWSPPGNDWCLETGGIDLAGWTQLSFWARGENGGELAEFKVGGLKNVDNEDCESMRRSLTSKRLKLTVEWQEYHILLRGQDLSQVMGGFVWVTNAKEETTIYLDEIRFEWVSP